MAQLIFDGLGGVSLDNQTVQSLLESQGLSSETSSMHHSAVLLDEEDLITCGKCKKAFSSVAQFMAHKEEHRLGLAMSRLNAQLTSDQLSRLHSGLDTELTAEQAGRLQGLEAVLSEEMSRTQLQRLHAGLDAQLLLPLVDGADILSFSIAPDGTFVSHTATLAVDLESDEELLSVASLELKPALGLDADADATQLLHLAGGGDGDAMPGLEHMEPALDHLDEMAQPMAELLETGEQIHMDGQAGQLKLEELVEGGAGEEMPAEGAEAGGGKRSRLHCEFCARTFTKNFDLAQHVRSHTGEKPFQCVVCGRGFAQKSNVKKHMATHKVWPEGLSRTLPETGEPELARQYVCQFCQAAFDSYYTLKTHMKTHKTYKVYKCIQTNCAATFSELDEFLRHSRSHPTKVKYRCHLCNLHFVSLANLGVHQSSHGKAAGADASASASARPKPYKFRCSTCKSRFVSPEALEHHKATSSHSFSCTHCDKWFICERYLRRHLRVHAPTASFRCGACGKGFRTEQYLAAHRVVHSAERPHACALCPAAFNRKDKLVRHMLIHRPGKMFKCPFGASLGCSREFNRNDKLKLHVLTHGTPRPLPCPVCGRTFARAGQLRAHQRSHKPPARCKTSAATAAAAAAAADSSEAQHSVTAAKGDLAEMPTIEIIVMPSSRSSEPGTGLYKVSFPTVHDQEVPV